MKNTYKAAILCLVLIAGLFAVFLAVSSNTPNNNEGASQPTATVSASPTQTSESNLSYTYSTDTLDHEFTLFYPENLSADINTEAGGRDDLILTSSTQNITVDLKSSSSNEPGKIIDSAVNRSGQFNYSFQKETVKSGVVANAPAGLGLYEIFTVSGEEVSTSTYAAVRVSSFQDRPYWLVIHDVNNNSAELIEEMVLGIVWK